MNYYIFVIVSTVLTLCPSVKAELYKYNDGTIKGINLGRVVAGTWYPYCAPFMDDFKPTNEEKAWTLAQKKGICVAEGKENLIGFKYKVTFAIPKDCVVVNQEGDVSEIKYSFYHVTEYICK